MKTIYVVRGYSGSYSDYTTWDVKAYASEKLAEEHVENATRRAREIAALPFVPARRILKEEKTKRVNEYDPRNGLADGYTYIEVEFDETLED